MRQTGFINIIIFIYFFLIQILIFKQALSLRKLCEDANACPDDSTCCVTSYGPKCLPVLNGVCCIDGKRACLPGHICISKFDNLCVPE